MFCSEFKITYNLKRLDQNSTSGENKVNLPTIKRIVSSFSIPDTMRFSDLRGFFLSLFLILYSMKIKEETKKLAAGYTWVRQGDVDAVWRDFRRVLAFLHPTTVDNEPKKEDDESSS